MKPARLSAPFAETEAQRSVTLWAEYLKKSAKFDIDGGLKFALVPPGEYTRGTSTSDRHKYLEIYRKMGVNFYDDELRSSEVLKDYEIAHRVIISHPMYVSRHELTEAQFARLLPTYHFTEAASKTIPMDGATWFDAVAACNALSRVEGLQEYYKLVLRGHWENDSISEAEVSISGGYGYRLLTEAEWEYSCRAGTETLWHFGDLPDSKKAHILPYGMTSNPENEPKPVGSFPPNAFGLYDMHGNVEEWCFDHSPDQPDYVRYQGGSVVDPMLMKGALERICRGATYRHGVNSRSAARNFWNPSERAAGIRICRTIQMPAE